MDKLFHQTAIVTITSTIAILMPALAHLSAKMRCHLVEIVLVVLRAVVVVNTRLLTGALTLGH